MIHSIGMSFLYPIPLGHGRQFAANLPKFWNSIASGWSLNGLTHWSAGAPITISSNRVTTGSTLTTTASIENMTAQQLQANMGVFERPTEFITVELCTEVERTRRV